MQTVSVGIEPGRTTPDSVLLADREIIILETHPQALLSDIEAVDIYQNRLYVLDRRVDKISVFDRQGAYVSTIGRRGREPGEYNKVIDFCVDRENEEIVIATSDPTKIMYYSLSGKFLGEIPTKDLLFQFVKWAIRSILL